MKKVQVAMYEYFMQKSFLRGLMNVNFVLYGVGLLLLALGVILRAAAGGVGLFLYDFLISAGLVCFWAGIVFATAKSDDNGLIIAFSGYILIYFAFFIIAFIAIFQAAVVLFTVFSSLVHLTVATLLLLSTIHSMPKYIAYKERKRAEAAAYAAQAAYAAAQNPYAPIAGQACFSCGFPLAPNAQFCPKCGSKQERPAPAPAPQPQAAQGKKCPACGADLSIDAVFCVKCGAKTT